LKIHTTNGNADKLCRRMMRIIISALFDPLRQLTSSPRRRSRHRFKNPFTMSNSRADTAHPARTQDGCSLHLRKDGGA